MGQSAATCVPGGSVAAGPHTIGVPKGYQPDDKVMIAPVHLRTAGALSDDDGTWAKSSPGQTYQSKPLPSFDVGDEKVYDSSSFANQRSFSPAPPPLPPDGEWGAGSRRNFQDTDNDYKVPSSCPPPHMASGHLLANQNSFAVSEASYCHPKPPGAADLVASRASFVSEAPSSATALHERNARLGGGRASQRESFVTDQGDHGGYSASPAIGLGSFAPSDVTHSERHASVMSTGGIRASPASLGGNYGSSEPYAPIDRTSGGSSHHTDASPPFSSEHFSPAPGRGFAPEQEDEDERLREAWGAGSVVEVYSASSGCWYPAIIKEVQPSDESEDIITVQFYINEEAKQKSNYRSDSQLAPLGSHTQGQLPPGFQLKPSQSRPGQLVHLDATTGMKYGSAELAWKVHLERMMQAPAVGLQTVCAIPRNKGQPQAEEYSTPLKGAMCGIGMAGSPPQEDAGANRCKAISLAELQAHGGPIAVPEQPWECGGAGERKVALPSFGEAAMDSQAAYLGYVGTPCGLQAASPPGYPTPQTHSAPSRPQHRPPVRTNSPALRTWQEDPFSQWRRS